MKQTMKTTVASPVVFSMGLPFGRWEELARAALGVSSGDETPMERLHDELLQTPETQSVSLGDVERLRHIRPASVQWPVWTPAAHGTARIGGIDARLCWTATAVAEACAEAHFILWVEHPGHALAHWLAIRPSDSAPAPVLEVIQSAVQSMLEFAQRNPSHCLVVDVDDALAQPHELASRLAAWHLAPHIANISGQPAADALARVLGARWAASDRKLICTHEHLSASCVVLSAATPAESPQADPDGIVPAALRLYAERRENRAPGSKQDASLEGDRAIAEVERWHQEAKEVSADRDALLLQFHQLQEKVAREFLAGTRVIPAPNPASRPSDGRIEAGAATDTAPLRGQTLKLSTVRIGGRSHERLTVRLVEHHGHPGIAIFEAESATEKPLRAWEPTGEKGKRAFMLFAPDDESSRQLLLQLGTDDWQFVRGLVSTIASRLRHQPSVAAPRWLTVAHQLMARLDNLPARLRFNGIDVTDLPSEKAIKVTLHDAVLCAHEAPELTLLWHVSGEEGQKGAIELLLPPESTSPAPLDGWPIDEGGRWSQRWRVPVAGAADAQLVQEWIALSDGDRKKLLAIIDTLPAVVGRSVELGIATGDRAKSMEALAQGVRASVERRANVLHKRQALRAMLGRVAT
jgi:hypothetical protein